MTDVVTTVLTVVVALAVGWTGWTLAAYLLHRYAMHELDGKGIVSREHAQHHSNPEWTVSSRNLVPWAGVLIAGVVVWAPPAWLIAGPAAAVAAPLGWLLGYSLYFAMHWGVHVGGPRTDRQAHVHKLHLHHHFGSPMRNHGFNVLVWDRLFGTLDDPDQVRVPRRLAPPWLVDRNGDVLPEYTADYVLVGPSDGVERTAGIERARSESVSAPLD